MAVDDVPRRMRLYTCTVLPVPGSEKETSRVWAIFDGGNEIPWENNLASERERDQLGR